MTRPLRILHIAPGEPFGGVQRIVLDLSAHQAVRHEVGILWTGEAERAVAQMPGNAIATMNATGAPHLRIFSARRMLGAFKPDIIHLHMPPPWIALALPDHHATVCYHLHGPPAVGKDWRATLAKSLNRRAIAQSDVLIAISEWIESAWRRVDPDAQYRCVYNGVPPGSRQAEIRDLDLTGKPLIGFASRLAHDKGVGEFANFVLALHRKLPNARYRVAGEGPERAKLEHRLSALIDSGHVELLGHIDDMPEFWSQLDLAVFSAPNEPFGLRLIEPVAHGVPVIAYQTGAGSDEIARNCAGIATVPYEECEALAGLATKLLADPKERLRMAREGRADIQRKFSIDSMGEGIDAVYREFAGKRDRSRS